MSRTLTTIAWLTAAVCLACAAYRLHELFSAFAVTPLN